MKKFYSLIAGIAIVSFLFTGLQESAAEQSDTVVAKNVLTIPTIDGVGDDAAWDSASWEPIDELWMDGSSEADPLGQVISAADFTGRYKVVWSNSENMLYFLVETTDDGTFDFGFTPSGSGYSDYDCIELFIDEDRSGGTHLMDGTGDVWGHPRSNGENAFAYHILPTTDLNSNPTATAAYVMDLAGSSGNPVQINYASHLGGFTVVKTGTSYVWEFSLKVYGDDYVNSSPEDSRVALTHGKIMGLSWAYNDDDDGGARDNMYGSILHKTVADQNASWWNADVFGVMKLINTAPNNAPTVANPIADINLTNTDALVVENDIKTVFTDSDGDNLSYSVVSDNVNLTVSIDGSDRLIVQSNGNLGGVATVTVTADDGLETVDDVFTVSDPVTSISKSFKDGISIYPQPANDFINISIQNNINSTVNFSIIDITGKNVMQVSYQKDNNILVQKINISVLSQGIYFLNIQQDGQKEVMKIIKY